MVKCGACGKFLAQNDAIKCSKCSATYHRACVSIPVTGSTRPTWVCSGCKIKIPREENTHVRGISAIQDSVADLQPAPAPALPPMPVPAPVVGCSAAGDAVAPPSTPPYGPPAQSANLVAEIRALRGELGAMRREIGEYRAEIREYRAEMKAYTNRIECLEAKVLAWECRLEGKAPGIDVEATIQELKLQLNERDQELLLSDLEITGLPESKDESPVHVVKMVAIKLGVELEDRDIVHVERTGPRFRNIVENATGAPVPPRPRNLVVTLARRAPRDQLLRAARVRRVINTSEFELTGSQGAAGGTPGASSRVYLNERLTRTNKQLFYQTREAARRCSWRYVWTRAGKIYARKEDGKAAERVRSEYDVNRVFGLEVVRV